MENTVTIFDALVKSMFPTVSQNLPQRSDKSA